MRLRIPYVFLVTIFAAAAGADDKVYTKVDPAPPPFEIKHDWQYRLPRHIGNYEPLRLEWQQDRRAGDASAVFCDPAIPAHVLVATARDLLETLDDGRSWNVVSAAAGIGPVQGLLFRPDSLSTWYACSRKRGIWVTTDSGKSFQPLAGKTTGLAADCVEALYFHPGDRLRRTLLAVHGEAAPGLSRSTDNGRSWQVLFPDYHIFALAFQGPEVVVIASSIKIPEARDVYFLSSLEEPWQTMLRDRYPLALVDPLLPRDRVYLATTEKGFFKIARGGGVVAGLPLLNDRQCASLGVTWGPTADDEIYYVYEPRQLGMVVMSTPQFDPSPGSADAVAAHYTTQSRGLYTGSIISDTACIRANGAGTVFYAIANKRLYVGRRTFSTLLVRDVTANPPLLQLRQAAAAALTITAHIDASAGHAAKSVTVDLSRLGLSERTPLLAQTGDGKTDSYTATVKLVTRNMENQRGDWRAGFPGRLGLTVSSLSESGRLAGAVGVLTLANPPIHSIPYETYMPARLAGAVEAGAFDDRSKPQWERYPHLRITKPGEFSVVMHNISSGPIDISSYYALSFLIRAAADTSDDICIQFQDEPQYAQPTRSSVVPILKEQFLPGRITTQFQRVIIPLARLRQDAPDFQPSLARMLLLSGNPSAPCEFFLKDFCFYPAKEDIPAPSP